MAPEFAVLAKVAAELRERSGQTEPAFSTRAIIDACFPSAVVTGRVLPDGVHEAVSRSSYGTLIIYGRGLPTAQKRFAIAHALAHVIFDDDSSACRPGYVGDPLVEERADDFAEELLVPLSELAPYVGRIPSDVPADQELYLDMVDEIASHFHVPSAVIDKRIRQLISRGAIS